MCLEKVLKKWHRLNHTRCPIHENVSSFLRDSFAGTTRTLPYLVSRNVSSTFNDIYSRVKERREQILGDVALLA